jgi:hypothetical protein
MLLAGSGMTAAAPPGESATNALPATTAATLGAPVTRQAKATDWPNFRGPTGMGTTSAVGLPVRWSETENVTWKTPLPGPGASSPIVFGGRIYLTCYTGFFVPGESGGTQ